MKAKLLSSLFMLVILSFTSTAQVVVDGKNVNEDDSIHYIQLSFYYSGSDMSPVYAVDYGNMMTDADQKVQRISVNGDLITNQMSPMNVLNKLYNAGWEYLGDAVFMRAPIIENTQSYTLRKRRTD